MPFFHRLPLPIPRRICQLLFFVHLSTCRFRVRIHINLRINLRRHSFFYFSSSLSFASLQSFLCPFRDDNLYHHQDCENDPYHDIARVNRHLQGEGREACRGRR